MQFQISDELIEKIRFLIEEKNDEELLLHLEDVHHADIAEILTELNLDEATYLVKLINSEKTAEALMELEEGVRERILENLSPKEIADELNEMDTDDAADIISELSPELQQDVIAEIEDEEHADHIVELLRYDEDSAGGLMAKELVKVNENWSVTGCMAEMRKQAENVTRVHSIYVVDDKNKLKGRLSLKDLLTASSNANISDVYIPQVDYVNVHTEGEEVARIMQKYDLEAIPVVDEMGRLVGRVTIDDIVDFIREEAEKDYQMAAGISEDVEADDNIFKQTRARLPWLLIGMFGGLGAASIISGFQTILTDYKELLIFVPLIQATAGNVGVQSSAIIVQGLANDTLKGNIVSRLAKEFGLALINGISIALIVFVISTYFFHTSFNESVSIGVALISVIVIAALIGTFIPIILNKNNVDPAVATGPFITTSNDVFGILTYFLIAKAILGF
ncbi:MAG: magnesium transporter [Bacteroidota bacterium]|uniref:Magnesium transporter MgtE n=1 Tax=Christiangramia flava JLT2011 TaxID=1229726 RepID=A0A1L7I453_9FLAO|nr:magnesium transporter [Christiangramia flava]APU68397.1 Mg/Co/Ni transporter MgtE [Christiangramia flava JLT2011]MAM18401.1 magnesium transporter [Christiangramia sp.]MEE2773127.1 magnesium transporter [Bacteroidota bacterium]OSS40815.1 Mg/Co/Ni transporter MgtE [Christiangramia flava JLT2011]